MSAAPKRSRTAQAVAAERAVLDGMGVLQDPYAATMLAPSMRTVLGGVRRLPHGVATRSGTLAGLAARVLWFDRQVLDALDSGIDQIVTVGAGYDSRPWRLARAGVRFFELDHHATQQDKRRRAPDGGPTFVAADLAEQDAGVLLAEHGLDPSRPALFVVEGVTMYLDEQLVRDQLHGLAAARAPGSRLAVDFYPPPAASTDVVGRRQLRLQRLARVGSGEGFRLTVDGPAAVGLVEATGWRVTAASGLRAVARDLVPRCTGLPVDSVNEHKTLVGAVLA